MATNLERLNEAVALLDGVPLYSMGVLRKTGAQIRALSGMFDKTEHARLRRYWEGIEELAQRTYYEAVADAESRYGDHGPLVSGVVRGHFPKSVKDDLRTLAHLITDAGDAAAIHRKASGAR